MVKSNKSDLTKIKNLVFTKANFSEIDFFIFKAKKIFIYLSKVFTKVSIFYYSKLKYYIHIETYVSGFAITRVFNKLILGQSFSNYVPYKLLNIYESAKRLINDTQ